MSMLDCQDSRTWAGLGAEAAEGESLQAAVASVVSSFADLCTIDLTQGGPVRRLAVAVSTPERVERLPELERYPLDWTAAEPIGAVADSAAPVRIANVSERLLAEIARDPEHLELLRSLNLRALASVQLRARGRAYGVITFVRRAPAQVFTAADREHAARAARLVSLLVDDQQRCREARAAVRARDVLLSVASHEIRSPLSLLQLQTDILARATHAGRQAAAGDLADRLEAMRHNIGRLSELTNRLLDVSRHQVGRLRLETEKFDLVTAIRDVVVRVVPEPEVRARVSVVARVPVLGVWDRVRIEQVVTNLLSNALKYGGGKPVAIEIEAEGNAVRLRVTDQGIGIPAERLDQIFGWGERAAPGAYEGLGIGLFVASEIVAAHGGSIRASSEAGSGATFTVELPRMAPTPPEPLEGAVAAG